MAGETKEIQWREVIEARTRPFHLDLKELWNYRDLLLILIRRDFLAIYKQTILGPIWFFLQPLLTTIVYVLVFSRIARISTSGIPPALFYLSGLVLWTYFSECVLRTSTFFKDNRQILTKVYFPRLIIPLSLIATNLVKLGIHLILFFCFYVYFLVTKGNFQPNAYALYLPALILLVAAMGLGVGLIVSSLTTRYKDLLHLTTFGVQLLMFVSPVLFPLSNFDNTTFQNFLLANPMTGIIEAFRFGFLGEGLFSWQLLAYDTVIIAILLFAGLVIFNSIERSFADTI